MERLLTRDAALIAGANLIPLAGVLFAGWDPFTLLMLFWFETAVIGLWICVAVSIARQDAIDIKVSNGQGVRPGIGIGLFIAAHAGVFMLVHLFFLLGFRDMGSHAPEPGLLDLFPSLLFQRGLWLPLAGLFVVRGLIAILDHRDGRSLEPAVVGFYLRIVVMQFAIIAGGFFVILAGATVVPLILLVILRTAIDLGIEGFSDGLTKALSTRPAEAGRT